MGLLEGTTTAGVGAGVESVGDGDAADCAPPVADRASAAPAAPAAADSVACVVPASTECLVWTVDLKCIEESLATRVSWYMFIWWGMANMGGFYSLY